MIAASVAFLFLAQQPAPAPPQIPDNIQADLDVEYSRVGARVAMDILRPKTPGPHPTILAVHGGGFRAGNRRSYIPLCIKAAQRGFACATASYRLAPGHQFPAPVEDVKAAVRFLRANAAKYEIDAANIGAIGGSAGGHLVLMLGLTANNKSFEGTGPNRDFSSAVKCVVNYYGPTDFTKSYEPGKSVDAAQVLPLFLGGDLEHNRKAHLLSSPLFYVSPQATPILSIHGTKDRYVAYEHSVWLTEKLKAAGAEAELETLVDADHGFKGADAEKAEARTFAFFEKHLKPAASKQQRIVISDHGPAGQVVAMEWPSGKELWTLPNDRGHDVQVLKNGHILFTVGPQRKVVEVDAAGKTVWTCCDGLEHPLAAQRLENGLTLIGDAKAGRVIEVDSAGAVKWQYASPDLANMRMRNAHRTAQGTTFIAVEAEAKLIEVDKDGKIVWQWQAPQGSKRRLYMGRRLPNGNVVMSLNDPGEVVEVDRAGKVIRSIGGEKMDIRMGWASGFAMLPNGNILISDYTGRRLLEVDAAGKVVNELRTGHRTVASLAVMLQ
jgi:acetyl esterase/lipase